MANPHRRKAGGSLRAASAQASGAVYPRRDFSIAAGITPPARSLLFRRRVLKFVRVALYQCYTWNYQVEVPPFDRLIGVLEAFFCSYSGGEYALETREKYRLSFRRGAWKRFLAFGPMIPARLAPQDFSQWPIVVNVLARPSPERFVVSLRYELYLPRSMKELVIEVQSSVDQHIRVELAELTRYLQECMQLETAPLLLAR